MVLNLLLCQVLAAMLEEMKAAMHKISGIWFFCRGSAYMSFNRFSLLFLMIVGIPAMAEQGCPPGQYPIGGQGVAACAPIPQGSSQETAPAPRPLGKWIKTWGAVALDGEGTVGVDYGKLSKEGLNKAV